MFHYHTAADARKGNESDPDAIIELKARRVIKFAGEVDIQTAKKERKDSGLALFESSKTDQLAESLPPRSPSSNPFEENNDSPGAPRNSAPLHNPLFVHTLSDGSKKTSGLLSQELAKLPPQLAWENQLQERRPLIDEWKIQYDPHLPLHKRYPPLIKATAEDWEAYYRRHPIALRGCSKAPEESSEPAVQIYRWPYGEEYRVW